MVVFDEEKQKKQLDAVHEEEAERLAQTLSSKYGYLYTTLATTTINPDALRLIDENQARKAEIAAFDIKNKDLSVGMLSPQNSAATTILASLKESGYTVHIYLVSRKSLENAWVYYKELSHSVESKTGSFDISHEAITRLLNDIHSTNDVTTLFDKTSSLNKSHRVSNILEILLSGALALHASDLHIEPEEVNARIRYRLDGLLTDISYIDTPTYSLILSRIKLLSGLKLNIKSNAQDGRFSIDIGDKSIEIRTSILPGAYGESIVLRVLNPESIAVPIESLGINPQLYRIIEQQLKKPTGMILTTGPTGSGKTTTLYAFLKKIYTTDIKVITIENPIEYHLPGIVQTQTDAEKGYTFLSGLRSALRQDPDVVMVGEIRDEETAEIAVNASLTGHLVFSTLHTNNAAGTFPRLIDLGVNPKIISSAVNLSLAQRLVRTLCAACKQQTTPTTEEEQIIDRIVATIKHTDIKKPYVLYKAVGCEKCGGTGYKGRTGIYEAIYMDESIEKAVIHNPSERDIRKAAESQNLYTLEQDSIIKILAGTTTLEEVRRVIDLGN